MAGLDFNVQSSGGAMSQLTNSPQMSRMFEIMSKAILIGGIYVLLIYYDTFSEGHLMLRNRLSKIFVSKHMWRTSIALIFLIAVNFLGLYADGVQTWLALPS
jgi:hypothetical protein